MRIQTFSWRLCVLCISVISFCSSKAPATRTCDVRPGSSQTDTPVATNPHEEWVILIHGTFALQALLSPQTVYRLAKDDIEESVYERTVLTLRNDDLFRQHHAMGPYGLHEVTPAEQARSGAERIAYCMEALSGNRQRRYFTFGWSGLVSSRERECAARELHTALTKLYRAAEVRPTITIIGYSHGGSLALMLPQCNEDHCLPDGAVDRLVLMSVPLHHETMGRACSPLFKEVWNIASKRDTIPLLDIMSTQARKSYRTFPSSAPGHVHNIFFELMGNSSLCCTNRCGKRHCQPLHYQPDHFSWWYMGWTYPHERNPLTPIPVVTYINSLLDLIEPLDIPGTMDVCWDVRTGKLTIHSRTKRKRFVIRTPFTPLQLQTVMDWLSAQHEEHICVESFKERTQEAIKEAVRARKTGLTS